MDHHGRMTKLRTTLAAARLDMLLVTHPANIRYLCGFTGSAALLAVAESGAVLFTDGRYIAQAAQEVVAARVSIIRGPLLAGVAQWLRRSHSRDIGVEGEHLTLAAHQALAGALGRSLRLRVTRGLVERLRMLKEPAELELIRNALRLGSRLLPVALRRLRPGTTEREVAAAMEFTARRLGTEGMAFDTIVASGLRSALPHARASSQPLPARGFVVLDFGVILAGYCSDMTRTVHLGRAGGRARSLYAAVKEAQAEARQAVRPGAAASEVDAAARRVLRHSRLERFFTHSTGHGLGLEVHEPPRLGKGQQQILMPGMVVTIEPGIYLPAEGGVRIEDVVLVDEGGCQVLTPASRDLVEVESRTQA